MKPDVVPNIFFQGIDTPEGVNLINFDPEEDGFLLLAGNSYNWQDEVMREWKDITVE